MRMWWGRTLAVVRVVAAVTVAVPAIGLGFLSLREGVTEAPGMPLDRAFHLGLGIALILLLGDFLTAILRSRRVGIVILLGSGGFLLTLMGGVAAEVLGPPVLLLLLVIGIVWACFLALAMRPGVADGTAAS